MIKNKDYPVLYVIVRNDLSSMNHGKAESHSGHAASAFHHEMTYLVSQEEMNEDFIEWMSSTNQGFGTQINLEGNIDDIWSIKNICNEEEILSDVVIDPTYPFYPDAKLNPRMFGVGAMTRREVTALYVFGRKNDFKIKSLLGGLELKK